MKEKICRLITVTLALISFVAGADDITEFTNYVQACKDGLGFDSIPQFSCDDIGFRGSDPSGGPFANSNDLVAHRVVNESVDALFACRWVVHSDVPAIRGNGTAASAEMLVHNRVTGKTCFFQLPNVNTGQNATPHVVTINPPSPTDRLGFLFWDTPTNTAKTQCTRCHSAGPYIASSPIVAALAQFGLINNGHDITGTNPANHYSAVGSLGDGSLAYNFNTIAATNRYPLENSCASQCHLLGGITPGNTVEPSIGTFSGQIVIPSINIAIDELTGIANPNKFPTLEHMPPFDDISNFHWVNLDTPTNSTPSTGVETENFADALASGGKSIVPVLFHGYDSNNPSVPSSPNCTAPGYNVPYALEAHIVGVPVNYGFNTSAMTQFPDRLRTFNLNEGLVCINSDQEPGQQCSDYAVRYMCKAFGPIVTWSDWYNTDSPGNDGDHEERSRHQNICGGINPVAIQARQLSGGGKPIDVMGPNDRLARFSPYGLTCNNTDQPDGQCSNYVVRYDGCVPPPATVYRTLTNVFVVGKQVTAAINYSAKGQAHNNAWDTQLWALEPVPNTEYVRLRNTNHNSNGSNTVYLYVTSAAEQATVATATFSNYSNQMWTVEPISGSTQVRLKNLFSGKYLTMADPKNVPNTPDYLPIYSQGLNTGWSSQRWIIQ